MNDDLAGVGAVGGDDSAGSAIGRHVVDATTFAALARARGGTAAVARLRAGQLSKRMLLVRALHRTAVRNRAVGGAGTVAAGIDALYRRLLDLSRRDPEAWRAVLLHPYLDEGFTRAVVALERGERLDPEWVRWWDRLVADPYGHDGPWPRVRAECDGRVLELRIADSGPFRDAHGYPLAEPLDGPALRHWEKALSAAWEVLVRRHPWHAAALADCLTVLVPLRPESGGTAVSSAARRAYGAVAASFQDDPVLLALTLVHEFLHVQLGALLDLLPLHGPSTGARHHAPWRPDPRPAGALLQGTYAHLGVTDFWRAELAAGTDGERARTEYDTWRHHTDTAAGTLLDSGELLPAGVRFVTELRTAVRRPEVRGPLRGREALAGDLRALGLRPGDTVLVHSSLRAVGPVVGGADTVVDALRDVLGPSGTLVVYTQTPDNSDPSRWHLTRGYAVPEERWPELRDSQPPFDLRTTPSHGVGVLPETVRARPDARRSAHPQSSFTALGARAAEVTGGHAPDCHLGERSPLARLEQLGARVLLLGVGHEVCTAFHLAEYRVPGRPWRTYDCVVGDGRGGREWYHYRDVTLDASPFGELGREYERVTAVARGRVGAADSRLLELAPAVAYATRWLTTAETAK
ncbi:HEXXH motif domain containing protein [Actinobacteria bacterium OK074]|nr:HEXXH motif domain containing protein [Actinobacteria bacterium OK074]